MRRVLCLMLTLASSIRDYTLYYIKLQDLFVFPLAEVRY